MTPERIAELRYLCADATPGEWGTSHPCGDHIIAIKSKTLICKAKKRGDALFIAAARTALPELLDALEAQEASYVRQLEDYADGVRSDKRYWQSRAETMEQALKKLLLPCRSCVHEKILGHVDYCGDCEYWCEIPGAKDLWQFDDARFKEPEALNCDTCAEPTKRVLSWGDGGTERKPVYTYEYTCDNLHCPIAIAREQKKQDEKKHREAVHNENLANGVDMKHLRNLRINADCLTLDAAQFLGVTSVIYNAYDCEKNPMPRDLYDRMVEFLKEADDHGKQ